jgi:hypothetical protein
MVVTVAVPLLTAFGEGGTRRDVVLHELERKGSTVDMLYLVEFEATQAGTPTSWEQMIERLDKLIIQPSRVWGKMLRSVREASSAILSRELSWLLEPSQKDEVTELVRALPAWSIMQWKVTPLETFAHRADIEKKVVQGLRTQK